MVSNRIPITSSRRGERVRETPEKSAGLGDGTIETEIGARFFKNARKTPTKKRKRKREESRNDG